MIEPVIPCLCGGLGGLLIGVLFPRIGIGRPVDFLAGVIGGLIGGRILASFGLADALPPGLGTGMPEGTLAPLAQAMAAGAISGAAMQVLAGLVLRITRK